MNLSELTEKLPFLAVIAGALLLAWSQRSKITGFVANLWPSTGKTSQSMKPVKRFETFYALRSWCESAGHDTAVKALDDHVLIAIVCDSCPHEVTQ